MLTSMTAVLGITVYGVKRLAAQRTKEEQHPRRSRKK